MYYVYILRCNDDSLYTGITNDLIKRMKAHKGIIKGGAKYTHSHPVVKIEAAWQTENKSSAAQMEYALKKLPRPKKLSLIDNPEHISGYTSCSSDAYFEVCSRELITKAFEDAE